MTSISIRNNVKSFIAAAALAAAAPLLFAQPAYAGYWSLSGTPTGGYSAGSSSTGISPYFTPSSMSFTDYANISSEPLTGSISYAGTIKWVPVNGNLQTDPAPATVTITETSDVFGEAAYLEGPATTTASDGLGDPDVTTTYTGYPGNDQITSSSGTHTTTVAVPAGGSYTLTRQFSNYTSSADLDEGLVNYQISVAMVAGINCGGAATGSWVADTDFSGGFTASVSNSINTASVTNPAPQSVYQSNRYGNLTYAIGGLTPNTSYIVRMHFAEDYWTAAGKREFNASINGSQVLSDFDIFATAGGEYIANIQQFTETTNASGQFVIAFTSVIDNAQINGIEIDSTVPAAPTGLTATGGYDQVILNWTGSTGATSYNIYRGTALGQEGTTPVATGITGTYFDNTGLIDGFTYYYEVAAVSPYGMSAMSNEVTGTPISGIPIVPINCGGAAVSPYLADTDFSGGGTNTWSTTVNTSLLSGTGPEAIPPQSVVQSDREGSTFTYTIPNLTANTTHSVTLYFVEQYWKAVGKRIFSVAANGTTVIPNLDVYATAGGDYIAIQKTFTTTTNSSGAIVLTFTASVDQAKCSGIAVY